MKITLTPIVFLSVLIAGCAAPQQVTQEASRYLRGNCLAMFTDSGFFKYQHMSQAIGGRAVFALAVGANDQYCGWASNNHRDVKESSFEILAPWEKLQVVAIARCEEAKPASVKEPCRVFARSNEIVWSKPNDTIKME